jgi:DNA helicase-2/ATP-dependent DNA helicase PcrA
MAQNIKLDEIVGLIKLRKNFLLSGGAGSGKTHSLVQIIKEIYDTDRTANIACITFTNEAVAQINDRVQSTKLKVSTIHEFLWECIKPFQNNLLKSLHKLIEAGIIVDADSDLLNSSEPIQYREWKKFKENTISHNEVISLSSRMFQDYPLLSDIVASKYRFIFIDEYQDTFSEVINILLVSLQKTKQKNIIGFFGDSMQSIYGNTGDITPFIPKVVTNIIKTDNRRNPTSVINLANKLRTDDLVQVSANDANSPNYNKAGSINFIYTLDNLSASKIDALKQSSLCKGWDFSPKKTRELYLTHRLIAPKAGFPELMEIYSSDPLLQYKNYLVKRIKEKNIEIDEAASLGDVINKKYLNFTRRQKEFIENNNTLFENAQKIPFSTFSKMYIDRSQLIGDKKRDEEQEKRGSKVDVLIAHLFNIQQCIYFYNNRMFNKFLRKTHCQISSVRDKKQLKEIMSTLSQMKNDTILSVINFAHENNVWKKDDAYGNFLNEKQYLFDRVSQISYNEIVNLFNYCEALTPYSTQHGIKGAEFDNVLVVLDNGNWNDYNFEYLFTNNKSEPQIFERTQRLFYVCCTRAKENLIVVYEKPSQHVINTAKEWFGDRNVHQI